MTTTINARGQGSNVPGRDRAPQVLAAAVAALAPLNETARGQALAAFDQKIKPIGSLGFLEELVGQLAAIRGEAPAARLCPAVVVCAADHGVVAEGVSIAGSEVNALMVSQFLTGGAAIAVFARQADTRLVIVDAGLGVRVQHPELIDCWIAPGTANLAVQAAMGIDEAVQALAAGIELAGRLVDDGITLIALGEMGIGNTTASSALTAAFLGGPAGAAVGPGTGLSSEGVSHKERVVERALVRHREAHPHGAEPIQVLADLGGLEIAMLAGVAIGAAARRTPVLVDGFIAGAAALTAARIAPVAAAYLIAGHRSAEPAHDRQLQALGLRPLLSLDLRLGEGTGAVLAIPLLQSALAAWSQMATFADLGLEL